MDAPLLQTTPSGLYCEAGDFYVDPWRPVGRAVVTHAHADHARPGSTRYLAAAPGEKVLRLRLGSATAIDALPYAEPVVHNGVTITFFPAGHVLGSAQVLIEHHGQRWVASGDYKLCADPTCAAFEPVSCHVFLTESTFGLPIYRWSAAQEVFGEINAWWRSNQQRGKASLLCGYSLGKAQRLLAGVDASIGPIFTHGAVENMNQAYRASGVALPATTHASAPPPGTDWSQALIVAPPSALASPWSRKFGPVSSAFASGWMAVRGPRRRRAVDRGFVVSDHADWPGLLQAIQATGAQRILVTHGQVAVLVRWLREHGLQADPLATLFEGEGEGEGEGEAAVEEAKP